MSYTLGGNKPQAPTVPPLEIKNPTEIFLEWKKRQFQYYDKGAKAVVEMKEPIKLLVLDRLYKIAGWGADGEKFFSNEIANTKTETLTVISKKGDSYNMHVKGLYGDIKDKLGGGKLYLSVYCFAEFADGSKRLCNISLAGSALRAFSEAKVKNGALVIAAPNTTPIKTKVKQDGKEITVTYFTPNFQTLEKEDNFVEESLPFAAELEKYLGLYFERQEQLEAAYGEANPTSSETGKVKDEQAQTGTDVEPEDMPF
jgi:hypothetical protein